MMKRMISAALAVLVLFSTAVSTRAQDATLKLPPSKKVTLKNGMTVLLLEQHEVPIISFNFIVRSGSVADPSGKEGLASLTAEMLRKGTKTRTADQVSNELDFIGGTLDADAGLDFTRGTAEFIKKDTGKGLDLLADVLLNPTFPQDEVSKLLQQRIDGIKAAKDQAQGVINNYYYSYLYGKHPYGRPTEGDEKTLAAISRDDVQRFYQAYYAPSNMILAVAGDFNTAEMERMLTDKFSAWAGKSAAVPVVTEVAPVSGKRLLLVNKPDATQTFFQIGNLGIARTNTDRAQIGVINTLFGGRFTSMLNTELRINSGLSYGARSAFEQRKVRGPFLIASYTQNDTTERAIDLALDVLKRLHEKGVTEEELKSAKTYVKGQYPPRIETTDQLAALISELEYYGLDASEVNDYYAKVDAMTLADARRIIKEYFPTDNLVFVLIGKSDAIQTAAKKYAPKFDTKSISDTGF